MRSKRTYRRARALTALVALAGTYFLGSGLWIPAKAMLAQYLLGSAWAETLAGSGAVRPWPWADTWPVARLRRPDGASDLIVLAGASGRTLAFGPGHLTGSALPGMPGNTVIGGHRDTHFAFLRDLATGDRLEVQRSDGRWLSYRVQDTEIVDSRLARIALRSAVSSLMLVTCYPFHAQRPGGPLRYVVTAVETKQKNAMF